VKEKRSPLRDGLLLIAHTLVPEVSTK